MIKDELKLLIDIATQAQNYSYAPYSKYNVGAALLTKSGKIYTGCNIENASYGGTICAERVALSKAISDGEKEFVAICIVGGKGFSVWGYAYPCGICRQFMSEFCDSDFEIALCDGEDVQILTLGELLPRAFGSDDIK
ncbi:MAG: cytidine deaminase [Clostridia bacterium]|nr:cytidine deaminase [Clostridia bacterium]